MDVACLTIINHLTFRLLIFKKPPWHLLTMLWFNLFLLLVWRSQTRSSENTFCLFIYSFDSFMSCLHASSFTLKELISSSQEQAFRCFHLRTSLREFHFFLFDFEQCIYLNRLTTFWPSFFHGTGIQIGCQVFKNTFLPGLDHC